MTLGPTGRLSPYKKFMKLGGAWMPRWEWATCKGIPDRIFGPLLAASDGAAPLQSRCMSARILLSGRRLACRALSGPTCLARALTGSGNAFAIQTFITRQSDEAWPHLPCGIFAGLIFLTQFCHACVMKSAALAIAGRALDSPPTAWPFDL